MTCAAAAADAQVPLLWRRCRRRARRCTRPDMGAPCRARQIRTTRRSTTDAGVRARAVAVHPILRVNVRRRVRCHGRSRDHPVRGMPSADRGGCVRRAVRSHITFSIAIALAGRPKADYGYVPAPRAVTTSAVQGVSAWDADQDQLVQSMRATEPVPVSAPAAAPLPRTVEVRQESGGGKRSDTPGAHGETGAVPRPPHFPRRLGGCSSKPPRAGR